MNIKKIVTSILACVVCAGIAVASAGCGCQKSKSTSGSGNNGDAQTSGRIYRNYPTDPDLTQGDFGYYFLNDKEYKVTVYNGNSKNITIPSTVDGARIKVIDTSLFRNSDIESVTIPDSINEIRDYAFAGCHELKEVVIPEGVTVIGQNAFWDCPKLEKITLPSSLKKVGEYAFSHTGITSITIPESETFVKLNRYVFYQNENLKEVVLPLSMTTIADDTFAECSSDLTITAYTGSFGASYAKTHRIALNELPR